jgi:hypothetical protein
VSYLLTARKLELYRGTKLKKELPTINFLDKNSIKAW